MEVKVRIADPAGNITIFVMSPADRRDYPAIARQLLDREEFHAEQVGFVEAKEGAGTHMQMMGGEFCGNATRSFGYLMSMLSPDKPKEVMVSVSGSDGLLKAEVDMERGRSRTQMPLPLNMQELCLEEGERYTMVVFEGICHIMVESGPKDQAFVDRIMTQADKVCPCDAYGVMFLEADRMTPVVYVKETDSMVWESSCGSGSMGAAVYLSGQKEDGEYTYELRQPGGIIEACVVKEKNKVVQCKMGGPVSISEEIRTEIEI